MKALKNVFKSLALPRVKTNKFDLSHDVKMSFNMSQLIPTTVAEVLPGDSFQINFENFLRFAPLISPIMHKVYVKTNYFFVPNRILWTGWEDFITGESDDAPPTINGLNTLDSKSLADYMGIPNDITNSVITANALPFAAYAKIWDDYYRDENLQDEICPSNLIPGNNPLIKAIAEASPQKRAWMHDYFTSALPFAQKGDAVTLPLTNNEQIDVTQKTDPLTQPPIITQMGANIGVPQTGADLGSQAAGGNLSDQNDSNFSVGIDPNGHWEVDINEEATDINTLRRAFRLQEWLEKNARGGTRYIENIFAHFDQKSSDQRLQRPEYIGGDTQYMRISEVLSTAQVTDTIPQGNMAGHGISVGGSKNFKYKAEEHGFIIGIISVQPDTAYQQGLHRMFNRNDKLDYAWPTFANIGEQEILNQEVYAQVGSIDSLRSTFGYVPRYSEYKYLNSRVAGEFRTNLAFWHLGRIFASQPQLNQEFIQCNASNRIFALNDEDSDTIYAHIYNNVHAVRKLPKYGIPEL